MNKGYFNWKLMILPIFNLLIVVCLLPILPSQIPIHFNYQWQIDSYGSKLTLLIMPVLLIGFCLLFQLLPHIDPLGKNYARFKKNYENTFVALSLFMFGTQFIMVSAAYSVDFIQPDVMFQVMIGLLFMYLGNIFPKIKHNYFMGIKTPWAICSEENWTMTHRFGAKIWFVGGFLAVLMAALPQPQRSACLFIDLMIVMIVPVIYSYNYFRKTRGKENA